MFKAIYHLFAGKRFDFDSPYSLDETYRRLYDLSERDKRNIHIWQQPRYYLLVEFESLNHSQYRFHADRDEMRNLHIIADGLVKQDITGVQINGVVTVGGFGSVMLTFLTIWFGFWIFTAFAVHSQVMGLFGFIVLGFALLSYERAQRAMYDRIYNLLGKSKKRSF